MKNKFESIVSFLVRRRKLLFYLTISLMVVTTFFSTLPSFDGKLVGFDLNENVFAQTLKRIESLFGTQNRLYIKITPANDNLQEVFSGLQELEKKLVEKFPEAKIISLHKFYYLLFPGEEKSSIQLSGFIREASSYPILNDLISNDTKSFLVVMVRDSLTNFDIHAFNSITGYRYTGIKQIKAISLFHIEDTIQQYIRKDFIVLSCAITIFFLLFFFFTFRSFSALLFNTAVIGISVFSSLFFFSIFNFHLNIITILVIPVVLVLSLSDSVHLLSGYAHFKHLTNQNERLINVVKLYILPSFFSSATTSVAFLSFYFFNDSEFIREFGLITGLSLMVEFFLTFFTAPYLLEKVNVSKINKKEINGFSNFLERNRKPFSLFFLLIFISSFYFVRKLEFKSDTNMFFPKNSELNKTHEELNRDFYSHIKLDILIEPKNNISNEDENYKLRTYVSSLTKLFRNTKNVVRVNSATDNHSIRLIPGSTINFLNHLGKRNPYYNKENNLYRIEIKVNNAESVKEIAYKILPSLIHKYPEYKISFTSVVLIMDYVNMRVSRSLINSLLTSGFFIAFMIFLLTRSIPITFASLLPNLVPLSIITYIYLLLGFEINILTAITAVVCLGILDDDTIHILYRRLWLKKPLDELPFSIFSTSVLLTIGFGMFCLSNFRPTQVLGGVSALVFFFGMICELTLTPWLIDLWIRRNENK